MKTLVIPWCVVYLTSFIRTGNANDKAAIVRRDAAIARQGFVYSDSEWKEIKSLPKEDRISRKFGKRLELHDCLKRKQHELRRSSRVFTHWAAGFEGHYIFGHLWTHGTWHKADMQKLRSLYMSCASSINFTTVQNLLRYTLLEFRCHSVDIRKQNIVSYTITFYLEIAFCLPDLNSDKELVSADDHEVPTMNRSLKGTGQEVFIPCTDGYSPSTTIPISSTEDKKPSGNTSEITTMESYGTTWKRTFVFIMILPSLILFPQLFIL